jgi:hypothetical protein
VRCWALESQAESTDHRPLNSRFGGRPVRGGISLGWNGGITRPLNL